MKAQVNMVVIVIFVVVALLVLMIFLSGLNANQSGMSNALNQTIGGMNG